MKTAVSALALLASLASANAADLSSPLNVLASSAKDSAPAWSGFYAGINGGGAWGNSDTKDTNGGVNPGPYKFSPDGFVGGGTVGYNVQLGSIVLGVEGDLGYMDLTGGKTIPSTNPDAHQSLSLDGGAYGDITGRVGFAIGQTLVYGKGGFAFIDGSGKQATTNPGFAITGTSARTGWTIGGGVERYITPSWSVKAEYQHFDFGSKDGSQTDTTTGFRFNNSSDVTADTVKVGLNYHIGNQTFNLQ